MEEPSRQTPPDPDARIAQLVLDYTHCDPTNEEEALAWLCTGLAWLLGRELQPCEGWTGWVDEVIPAHGMVPDAAKPIGRHIRWDRWYSPAQWMFRFTKNAPSEPPRLQ